MLQKSRHRTHSNWRLSALLLLLALLLCGCMTKPTDAKSVLDALRNAEKPSPTGRAYHLSATPDSKEYISKELLSTLFGNGSLPPALSSVEDAAFFFSLNTPCELSLLRCQNRSQTEAVAKLCLLRLEHLRNTYAENSAAADKLKNATVSIRGNWVLLCVSADTEAVLRAFRQAV